MELRECVYECVRTHMRVCESDRQTGRQRLKDRHRKTLREWGGGDREGVREGGDREKGRGERELGRAGLGECTRVNKNLFV